MKKSAMKKSRALQDGMLVSRRGDKVIVYGRRSRPLGVFSTAKWRAIMDLNTGDITRYAEPEGVIIDGHASVQVKR